MSKLFELMYYSLLNVHCYINIILQKYYSNIFEVKGTGVL